MIRVVVSVCVASALLAASLPAVEDARADRTATSLDRAGERLVRAAESLVAADAAEAGARRIVQLRIPTGSLGEAGVREVRFECDPVCSMRYRLGDGRRGRTSLESVPLATPDGPVSLSRPGTHRLRLGLAHDDDERVVTVRG